MDIITSLLDNLDQAVVVMDHEGRILLYNKVAAKLANALLTKPLKIGTNLANLRDLNTSLMVREIIEQMHVAKVEVKHLADVSDYSWMRYMLEFKFIPVLNEKLELAFIHLLIRQQAIVNEGRRNSA